MTRTAARHIAVQLGFASAAALLPAEEVAEVFFEPTHYATLAEEDPLYAEPPSPSEEAFILDCIRGIEECREELDAYIGKYAKSWRTERISRVAAAVMRQAIFEMLRMPDIPPSVSIDEAVELSKGYEEPEVVAFINGVLGGFYRGELAEEAGADE